MELPYNSSDSEEFVSVEGEFDNNPQQNLSASLASWAVRNHCTQACVKELLNILRHHGHSDLPKDSRTLLKTPRNVPIS